MTNSASLVKALRVSPETAAEFADAGGGLVDALLDLLNERLRADVEQLAARLAADAGARLGLYHQLMAGELAGHLDDPRGFALAAQQAAARNGISRIPCTNCAHAASPTRLLRSGQTCATPPTLTRYESRHPKQAPTSTCLDSDPDSGRGMEG